MYLLFLIFTIAYKISASRMKKQVYLHFSEAPPNFCVREATLKLVQGERNIKFI